MPCSSETSRPGHRPSPSRRPGRGAVEVIVIAGIVGFVALCFLMALPRGREASRLVACQRNLMQVGLGLQMYHQAQRRYPEVPSLDGAGGVGPIKAMLDTFALPDLLEIRDPTRPPGPTAAAPPGVRIPGLACPSDPNATRGPFSAVVSYRANAGDTPTGQGGPFQPGRAMTSAEVEAADGLGYTAAFAERLVGDGRPAQSDPANYASSPGAVAADGCDDLPPDRWRGDAGSDWAEATWRSTLYGHGPTPNAPRSCIAEDGRSASMGASSAHVNRINVLLLDGSLRAISPTIDRRVWAGLGTVGSPRPQSP